MNAHDILIGGVRIGLDAAYSLSQTYEPIGGRSLRRKLDGSGLLQSQWSKLRTTISGSGRMPEGLAGLDYTASLSISCMAPRSIWSAGTAVTLPASRRTDWAPHAYAIVDGRHVRTPIAIVGNAGTLTAVSGAQGYVTAYYPVLTCYAELRQTFDGRGPDAGWEIIAEEV